MTEKNMGRAAVTDAPQKTNDERDVNTAELLKSAMPKCYAALAAQGLTAADFAKSLPKATDSILRTIKL
jgi:hypothetical protein